MMLARKRNLSVKIAKKIANKKIIPESRKPVPRHANARSRRPVFHRLALRQSGDALGDEGEEVDEGLDDTSSQGEPQDSADRNGHRQPESGREPVGRRCHVVLVTSGSLHLTLPSV